MTHTVYWPAEARWCSSVCHHVSLNRPTANVAHHSMVSESCLYDTISYASYALCSDLWQRAHWGDASVNTLSAGLLQRYTYRNSWHSDERAAINSECRCLFNVRSKSLGPYQCPTQLPLASDVVYIHLLFTRNGSNRKKEIQKKKIKKYTNIKSESTINQYAL